MSPRGPWEGSAQACPAHGQSPGALGRLRPPECLDGGHGVPGAEVQSTPGWSARPADHPPVVSLTSL